MYVHLSWVRRKRLDECIVARRAWWRLIIIRDLAESDRHFRPCQKVIAPPSARNRSGSSLRRRHTRTGSRCHGNSGGVTVMQNKDHWLQQPLLQRNSCRGSHLHHNDMHCSFVASHFDAAEVRFYECGGDSRSRPHPHFWLGIERVLSLYVDRTWHWKGKGDACAVVIDKIFVPRSTRTLIGINGFL